MYIHTRGSLLESLTGEVDFMLVERQGIIKLVREFCPATTYVSRASHEASNV